MDITDNIYNQPPDLMEADTFCYAASDIILAGGTLERGRRKKEEGRDREREKEIEGMFVLGERE